MLSHLLKSSLTRNGNLKNVLYNITRFNSSENVTGPVMGIDLGTTNSCVAIMEGTTPQVIQNVEGYRTTPSVVAFTEENDVVVGEPAKRQAVSNSRNTVYGTKRLIGRRFNDPEVQKEAKQLPFQLIESKNGDCWVRARGKDYSPSQIGAYVLMKMKETASAYLTKDVRDAVITVPAYFNDSQRQATKDAGSIAGLNVVRIINEPTAAALAYGLNKKNLNKTIAVYDLGGGTFDISILEINDGVFEVKSTNGDTRLGGEDFDNAIITYLINDINKKLKIDVKRDLKALQRIKEAAEKAKIELSTLTQTEINLPYIVGAESYSAKMTRPQLENLVGDFVERTIPPCKAAVSDASLTVNKLDEVLLVGGMTRMPKVQQVVKEYFQKEPSKGVNPDEAVAVGASIQGGVLVGSVNDIVLVDVTPYSLGVKTLGDVFSAIVTKNTSIPTRKSELYTTSEDNQTYVGISVYQGERAMCSDNLHLGDFQLGPIPSRPRGMSRIEVTFELDSNGIVKVHAADAESGIKANATLKSNPRGLSKQELDRMAKEAEREREKDVEKKEVAQAKIESEAVLYDCRQFVKKDGSKVPESELTAFNEKLVEFQAKVLNAEGKKEQFYREERNKMIEELARLKRLVDQQSSTSNESTTSNESSDQTTQSKE